jgi:monofunctional glycosyltransferase
MDRSDETSGLSAAPSRTSPAEKTAPVGEARKAAYDRPPPRPLPASAFLTRAPIDHSDAIASAGGQRAATEPLSPDAAFSEIEAEASTRSLSAVETAIAGALREIKPHKPIEISEVSLPATPPPPVEVDLGRTIPQRMREPRLEIVPPPAAASDGLHIYPSMQRGAQASVEAVPPPGRVNGSLVKRGAKLLVWIVVCWLAVVLSLIVAYRFVNPPASMLMLQTWLSGERVTQKWAPFEEISPNVVRAVLLSEDARFCRHSGIDFEAIEDAIENTDGRARGGSTISMQVVKNLFLWPSKSYIRKAIELPLTYVMELVLPKRRIMEIYLNIAQWGPGIFGIGAAAEYHFDKPARKLSEREAARLAVSLPNPLTRNAGRPGPGLRRLANAIQVRMRLAPSSQLSCVLPRRIY